MSQWPHTSQTAANDKWSDVSAGCKPALLIVMNGAPLTLLSPTALIQLSAETQLNPWKRYTPPDQTCPQWSYRPLSTQSVDVLRPTLCLLWGRALNLQLQGLHLVCKNYLFFSSFQRGTFSLKYHLNVWRVIWQVWFASDQRHTSVTKHGLKLTSWHYCQINCKGL